MNRERKSAQYIQDMLESLQRIERYCAGVTAEGFAADLLLQDAVVRRLEVIGEASKHVPQEMREQYRDIPWRSIAGLRDVLIHDYSGVNVERIWQVVTLDLPAVKPQLLQVQADLQGT